VLGKFKLGYFNVPIEIPVKISFLQDKKSNRTEYKKNKTTDSCLDYKGAMDHKLV
jgi:hypothetical protein